MRHRSAVPTRLARGFYGYKLHAAVSTRTRLPLAWRVETARAAESLPVESLLDTALPRGFRPVTCAMDMGDDFNTTYDACAERGIAAIAPLRKLKSSLPVGASTCEHGTWTFAEADFKRKATKWRCPTGECEPKSKWVMADRNPLVPRETKR